VCFAVSNFVLTEVDGLITISYCMLPFFLAFGGHRKRDACCCSCTGGNPVVLHKVSIYASFSFFCVNFVT
jgi:hypothetical protein